MHAAAPRLKSPTTPAASEKLGRDKSSQPTGMEMGMEMGIGTWAYRVGGATLPLSRPGDRDEVEADRLAERALAPGATRGIASPVATTFDGAPRVRRCAKCAAAGVPCRCGEEEEVHRKEAGPTSADAVPAAAVEPVTRTAGQPLDAGTRAFFEMRFGRDLGGVRVHADGAAARSARAADALAYTVGSHVVFGAGQFAPASAAGTRLLAHELAHVVQHQRGAPPAVRRQTPGGEVSQAERERLEREWAERDERECMTDASRGRPPRCTFTGDQQARIDGFRATGLALAGRAAAAARTGDPAMTALARRIFHVPTVDLNDMASKVDRIAAALASWPILCATCGDPNCQSLGIRRTASRILAVVPEGERVILVCPVFWSAEFTEANRRRTLLHEAGHAAGIDAMADYTHPTNCDGADCDDPCPNVTDMRSVDAWAWFIQCAEGVLTRDRATQTPDDSRRRRLTALHYDALGVIGRAAAALSSGDRYMATLATRHFGIQNPDLQAMAGMIVRVHAALSSRQLRVAAPGEALCAPDNRTTGRATTSAVMPEDLGAIVICDGFWGLGPEAQRRELIREAAHAAALDGGRAYARTGDCPPGGDCRTACTHTDGLASSEAWAVYIPCAAFSR